MEIKDKVVIITGAGDGLGKATAINLSNQGVKIALVGKTESKLISVANECGKDSKYYLCDIRDKKQINQAVEKVIKDFGKIDILINNAGVFYEGDFHEEKDDDTSNMIETNVTGLINFTREVLPHMIDQKSGQILNVSSVAGTDPGPEYAVYTASKHAVTGFTKSLKSEVGKHNIRVMAINPGPISTNILKAAGYKYDFSGNAMSPEYLANIISFMLSQPMEINIEELRVRPLNY